MSFANDLGKYMRARWELGIDATNEKIGNYVSILLIPMTLMMTWEIVSRRLFNIPTSWAWPLCVQVECVLAGLAGGYCFLHHMHVRVDIIYTHFSERKRTIVELVICVLALFALGLALWSSIDMGTVSFGFREYTMSGFRPPIWHLKLLVIPLAIVFFLLQVLATLKHNLQTVLRRLK